MKTILFTKKHGNHAPQNAGLEVYAKFESYAEAKQARTDIIKKQYAEACTNDDFDTYEEEQLNYWAIYSEGGDAFIDDHFFE